MKQRQSARLAKLQASRRAQQLPCPDPTGADESFRKLQDAVRTAKAERDWWRHKAARLSYIFPIVSFCLGAAGAICGIHLIIN